MELRDDDPLGAVDHEGPVAGHQRNLAEVDFLLLDVLDRAPPVLDVPDDQLNLDLQRRRIGHPALMAFLDVVLGLAQLVGDEFQRGGLVEILDREDRLEHRLQAGVGALIGGNAGLQEFLVRALLNFDQIRDVDNLLDFAETAAQTKITRHLGQLSHRYLAWRPNARAMQNVERAPGPACRMPRAPRLLSQCNGAVRRGPSPLPPARLHKIRIAPNTWTYFSSTVAPASTSFFCTSSASALVTPSLTALGAPSTRSLASLRPRPVSSRTTLITWIFFSPDPVSITVNSSFSTAGAAAPAAGPAAATATGAAADTPSSCSSSFTRAAASIRLMFFKKSLT